MLDVGSKVKVVEIVYTDDVLAERSMFLHRIGTVVAEHKVEFSGYIYKVEFEGLTSSGVWFSSEELDVIGDDFDDDFDDGSLTTQELLYEIMQ